MGNFREDFSRMLRSARAAQKLTQSQVAEVLQINRSTYTYYESGKTMTGLKEIRVLVSLYHIPAEAFIFPERYLNEAVQVKPRRRRKG